MRPGTGAWRLPGPGRPVLGATAADPAGRTAGQGTHQTAGSSSADGSGIALTALAPPVRRHHPGSDGDEIAVAIRECRLAARHLRDRFCRHGHLRPVNYAPAHSGSIGEAYATRQPSGRAGRISVGTPNRSYSHAALRFVSRSMVPCLLRLVLRRLAWVTAAGEAGAGSSPLC